MNITVEGLDKLERDFRLVRDRASANQLERFCLQGAQEMADLIRPNAPVGTTSHHPGLLKSSVQAFKAKRGRRYVASAISWLNYQKAKHITLVANDTQPHLIRPKNKRALRVRGGASEFISARAKHPGTKANLFFQKTVEIHGYRIVTKVSQNIAQWMFPQG